MRDYRFLKEVGERIRIQRDAIGMTRESFAERVGVSVNFCSDVELGKKGMSLHTLSKVADVLSVSTDYILLGKANMGDAYAILRMLETCDDTQLYYAQQILKNFVLACKESESSSL